MVWTLDSEFYHIGISQKQPLHNEAFLSIYLTLVLHYSTTFPPRRRRIQTPIVLYGYIILNDSIMVNFSIDLNE